MLSCRTFINKYDQHGYRHLVFGNNKSHSVKNHSEYNKTYSVYEFM